MLEMHGNTSAVKTDNDSFPSAPSPPPYSPHVSGESCNSGENNVNPSDSVSQLLDKTNVFQIDWKNGIGRHVLDGSGTLLLSVLSQHTFGSDCYLRTQYLFLNSTGKQVMEMTRAIEYNKNDSTFKTTCTVHEGGRVVGFLTHEVGKEMVGYRISGKEMFRASVSPTLTVRGNGKDMAVIATKDNPSSTSLVMYHQDEQLEIKALLLCGAIYNDALAGFSAISKDVHGGRQIVQRSERSTSRDVEGGNRSIRIRGALDMAIRFFLVLILVMLVFILIKAT